MVSQRDGKRVAGYAVGPPAAAARSGFRLRQVVIPDLPQAARSIKLSSPATREFWELSVLYEDQYLLAIDKPSGLATSPDRYNPDRPSLLKLLHSGIAEARPWARERNLAYLMNAHRL